MTQKLHSKRLFAAALAALLVDSLAGGSGLVFCSAANGHRAIEFEHNVTGCPTLANSKAATSVFTQPAGECVDVPSAGAGFATAASFDADRLPMPPMTMAVPAHEPTLRIEMRFSTSANPRTGPPNLALHLRSTILLV